jgi:hypothetical protein
LAAFVALFFVSDEERCAGYWAYPHPGGACNCHSITNFGSILRVSAGAKINSGRCENIGASAIWAVEGQVYLNNAPICASYLREIGDLHEMIVRHNDFKKGIAARDDFAFKRISEANGCGGKKNRSDKKSHAEHFHDSTDKPDLSFGH